MSNSEHTPGPWKVAKSDETKVLHAETDMVICRCDSMSLDMTAVEILDAEIANANLIAAAPDMYEALKNLMLLDQPGRGALFDDRWKVAKAVIAKAEAKS